MGKIYFLLVRIKLKYMEVEIRRKETTGAGSAAHNESDTIAKWVVAGRRWGTWVGHANGPRRSAPHLRPRRG
mgnify:CR=1 FL=1